MAERQPLKLDKAKTAENVMDEIGRIMALAPNLPVVIRNERTGQVFRVKSIVKATQSGTQAVLITFGR